MNKIRTSLKIAAGLAGQAPVLFRRFRFPRSADKLLDDFLDDMVPNSAYDDLVRYMAISWATYRNKSSSGARLPGLPSWSGSECDALEGFSRTMPLFGAWCSSGRTPDIELTGGRRLSLTREFKKGLLAGTDPQNPDYWGDMPGRSNQRIVEAADVALALWLFRDRVWHDLTEQERETIVNWLSLVHGRPGLDNNWHLFFVLIDRVITALGFPGRIGGVRGHYNRVMEFYIGDGWFRDGPDGPVDYYSAWGFHYLLTWIQRIDPKWDPATIHSIQSDFLESYKYLIGPRGFPILGRSVQYRMAAPAPLVAGAGTHPGTVTYGEARRALDVTWHHFLERGALRGGVITQGYYGTNPEILDPYSGPASSLWSLRSLVMAFHYPPDHAFWQSRTEPLPVERRDFDLILKGPKWRVAGKQSTGTIIIEILDNAPGAFPVLKPFGRMKILRNFTTGRPQRPKNLEAKYGRRFYRSDIPFFMDSKDH